MAAYWKKLLFFQRNFASNVYKNVIYLKNIIIPITKLCEDNVHKYSCTRSSRLVENFWSYIVRKL